jgi:hypothetical protein
MRARGDSLDVELLVLAMLGLALLAALVVDMTGGLAGLLFGDGWVDVPLAEMPAGGVDTRPDQRPASDDEQGLIVPVAQTCFAVAPILEAGALRRSRRSEPGG